MLKLYSIFDVQPKIQIWNWLKYTAWRQQKIVRNNERSSCTHTFDILSGLGCRLQKKINTYIIRDFLYTKYVFSSHDEICMTYVCKYV